MLSKVVRVYPASPLYARTVLNDLYERLQSVGFVQRKVVTVDVTFMNDIAGVIDAEFPARSKGDFCLDGEPSYADFVDKTFEVQNIVLTGSRRIPTYEEGYFECTS